MRLKRLLAVLVGLGMLAGASVPLAHAAATREEAAEARQHFQKGQRHYDLHEYSEALAEFKDAYRVVPDAVLLYNIGQCHWKLGAKRDAVVFYRQYLRRRPEAANREEVQARVNELETEMAQEQKGPVPASPTPKPGPRSDRAAPIVPASNGPAPAVAVPDKVAPTVPMPAEPVTPSSVTATDPSLQFSGPAAAPENATPIYKRWWFWTAAAVVVTAGVGVALLASGRTEVGNCLDLGPNCARIGQ